MSNLERNKALGILRSPERNSPLVVHNAVVDLRRNPKAGDESLLKSFLHYPDDMVVSAVLFSLIHVYDSVPDLLERLLHFADGDDRDNGEMPIQSQAIEGLFVLSRESSEAFAKLLAVADDVETPAAPRARAWKCLAELFGVPWSRGYTEAMIWDPESDESSAVRKKVRTAIDARDGRPLSD